MRSTWDQPPHRYCANRRAKRGAHAKSTMPRES
jgi:hypothetical protein